MNRIHPFTTDRTRRNLLLSGTAAALGLGSGVLPAHAAGLSRSGANGTPVPGQRISLIDQPLRFDDRYMGLSVPARLAQSSGVSIAWARSHDQAPIWRAMNPARGAFVDAGMRKWIDTMKFRGAKIMITLCSTPTWASARPNEGIDGYGTPGGKAEPADPQYMVEFMQWFLSQYGSEIDVFELWNEPKYTYSGNPPGSINASFYSGTPQSLVANIAKPCYQTIKSMAPHIKIAGVACTGVTFGDPGSGIDYTNRFLNASDGGTRIGRDYIDILSIHTYVHDGNNTLTVVSDVGPLLADLKARNGIASLPVFATEYGFIDPPLATYGDPRAMVLMLMNYAVRNRAAGIDVNIGYSDLAFFNSPEFVSLYNQFCIVIQGGLMTRCESFAGTSDIECVIDDKTYFLPGAGSPCRVSRSCYS